MPRHLSHIIIAIIYQPPAADSYATVMHIVERLDLLSRRHPSCGIILTGDFNRLPDSQIRQFPLQQVVRAPTRGTATLDKIYTNVQKWYCEPHILPNIGKSDHMVVCLKPKSADQQPHGKRVRVAVRSNDSSAKLDMEIALRQHNWSAMYALESTEAMCCYFNNVVTSLLDSYLPVRHVFRHTADKPWVTDQFRQLIRRRQYAYTSGNHDAYTKLRNKVNRLSKQLQVTYYKKRVDGLRDANPRRWWSEIHSLSGTRTIDESSFMALANNVADGNLQSLASQFCQSLKHVSDDLVPLDPVADIAPGEFPDNYIIYPEEVFDKLDNINIYKSPGPDTLPNWFLRDFAVYLSEPLCSIFNTSLR